MCSVPDGASHQFLAGSCFTRNQYGLAPCRYAQYGFCQIQNCGRSPYHAAQPLFTGQLKPKKTVFVAEGTHFSHLPDRQDKFVVFEGLQYVIVRAQLNRFDSRWYRAIRGHQHYLRAVGTGLYVTKQFHPIHARHVNVAQNNVYFCCLKKFQRLVTGERGDRSYPASDKVRAHTSATVGWSSMTRTVTLALSERAI